MVPLSNQVFGVRVLDLAQERFDRFVRDQQLRESEAGLAAERLRNRIENRLRFRR
jgi:ribosomal protein S3